jgi:GH24 family phage-related lysozyme (muramidase)
MKENTTKGHAPTKTPHGLSNDFSEQEESMTASAMPPKFALSASAAAADGGTAKKPTHKPKLNIAGVPPELVAMLEDFESIEWDVYVDTQGHLTGGMGHLIKAEEMAAFPEHTTVSQAQIEAWAQADVSVAWERAQAMSAELGVADHDFHVAMASMCFQNGLYWNTIHVKTWALMKEHKWEEAATECADSDWARQTPSRVPGFQAALRSQVAVPDNDEPMPEATETTRLHKHALAPKDKALKVAAAQKGPEKHGHAAPKGKEGMKQVQTRLQALGLYAGKIDGVAVSRRGESDTVKGIKRFQEMQGLPVTGTVDAVTWEKLSAAKPGDGQSVWDRFMAKQEADGKGKSANKDDGGLAAPFVKLAAESKTKEAKPKGKIEAKEGWTVGPLLGTGEFYSQIHPQNGSDKPIPRSVAFSKALIDYEHGGSRDIYDNSKCKDEWQSLSIVEREKKVYLLACKNTCDFIAENAGFNVGGAAESIYSLIEKREGKAKTLEVADTYEAAKNRLDAYLENGIPVVVGMDYKMNGKNASATDHFVVVIGRGEDEKGVFYAYMDVGRTLAKDGADFQKNRIYVGIGKDGAEAENWISGAKPSNPSIFYSLSEVREMTSKN